MEDVRYLILDKDLSGFASMGAAAAGLLCAVALLKISHDYLSGHGITLWQVVRPLVMLILVCNFDTFVMGPVHAFCNVFTEGISSSVQFEQKQFTQRLMSLWNKDFEEAKVDFEKLKDTGDEAAEGDHTALDEVDQTKNFLEKGWLRIKTWVLGAWTNLAHNSEMSYDLLVDMPVTCLIFPLFEGILWFIMNFVLVFQQISCYIYLILLGLLGPFAFALSIVPSFSRSAPSWIARYIQISFWIPIGQLILYINYEMLGLLSESVSGYEMAAKYFLMIAMVVCIQNIRAVPNIASFVIESAGDSGSHHVAGARQVLGEVGGMVGDVTRGRVLSGVGRLT